MKKYSHNISLVLEKYKNQRADDYGQKKLEFEFKKTVLNQKNLAFPYLRQRLKFPQPHGCRNNDREEHNF